MKRIAIFADGTWNSPEQETPTNVLQLARAVRPSANQVKQVAFYDWGIGTDRKKVSGGISGAGIDKNIQDCYRFLVHNYQSNDKLYFFGFNRGAYTVRSLCGLIRNCGLLKRQHADMIDDAYELYRKRSKASSPDAKTASDFRKQYAVANKTKIEFLGVWDTVGALGIPIPFLGNLGESKYLFHDVEPSSIINHARHAVSIDENREDFAPTLWSEKPGLDLLQVWFSGVHADVGGGYKEHGLGDHAGHWMIQQAQKFGLKFEKHLVDSLNPDHADKQHNERKGIYTLRGNFTRSINGPLHHSVQKRWDADAHNYRKKSKAMQNLLASVGNDWSQITIEK